MSYQRTIKQPVTISGIGLHSGEMVTAVVKPAQAGSGIKFQRAGGEVMHALFKNVKASLMAVTLGEGKSAISTVEHFLSAMSGLEIDNLFIEVSGGEMPVLDGSSYLILAALEKAGIVFQAEPRSFVRVKRRVEIHEGDRSVVIEPGRGLEIKAIIEWENSLIGKQTFSYVHGPETYRAVAAARTFGFKADADKLRALGLARGGSLDTAVVLDGPEVLNPEGLRFKDEFVRHKVLDAVGDLSLAGLPLEAEVTLVKSGHALHVKALAELFSNDANYEVIRKVDHVAVLGRPFDAVAAV